MSSNKIQVRLTDGTVGVPDKFIAYDIEYDTQSQAEEAIKNETYKQLDIWLDDNTYLTAANRDTFIKDIDKLDYSTLHTFISLLSNLT